MTEQLTPEQIEAVASTLGVMVKSPETVDPGLRVADRCDHGGCNAQALVITQHEAGRLLWCSHHYNELPVTVQALAILDARNEVPC